MTERKYRVYDDRDKEKTLHTGTHNECMEYIWESVIDNDFTHIWMEEVKE